MIVGVLALQGDFARHEAALGRFRVASRPVRSAEDLASVDGLVLPGGESGAMLRLMRRSPFENGAGAESLFEALAKTARRVPVLGTCAGLILLATDVQSPHQQSLGILDLTVHRNGYGRQIVSGTFVLEGNHLPEGTEGVFIRAPRITRVGPDVQVLATRDGDPVFVANGNVLATCFHPELVDDHVVTRMFVERLQRRLQTI